MIEFDLAHEQKKSSIAVIKVVGIGGAGGNTVNSIIDSGYEDIECIVVNSDVQALELSKAATKIQIGIKSTKGLGTGADPEIGKRAAEEDLDKVMEAIGNADIVFLAGGMGGGTGSGGLPVIAKALKEKNILSIVIVTKPFLFEGKRRARVAHEIVEQLKQIVDTLIVIPNQKLLEVADQHVSMIDAFDMINQVLSQSVRAISDIITKPGHINVDYADVRTIMKDRGLAVMGNGRAAGKERARNAAVQAISSPLLENMSIEGAHGVLLNITGGKNLSLHEISQAASVVYEQAHEDANIIIGSVIDASLEDDVLVTVIATGFQGQCVLGKNAQSSMEVPIRESEVVAQVAAQPEEQQPFTTALNAAQKDHAEKDASFFTKNKQDLYSFDVESLDSDDLDMPTFLREKSVKEAKSDQ